MEKWIKRIAFAWVAILVVLSVAGGYWLVWGEGRCIYLPYASKLAVHYDLLQTAESYAKEMLESAETISVDSSWDYGNRIHHGNITYGRVALKRGDVKEAKRRLLAAGKTPGSPQLDSFGPNMLLAKELLEKGENEAVVAYLDLCKRFWKIDDGKLAAWKAEIEGGQVPDFGRSLHQ